MEVLDAIFSRRSIRNFLRKEIPNHITEKLLEAAMYAPSARNTQSWQFVVINNRKILDNLAVIHPYAGMLAEATEAIVVCGDKTTENNEAYLAINCAASTQNILLAAHAMELGSVWLGVYPKTERINAITSLLNLPQYVLPVSLIALGWPGEEKLKPERFNKDKIHYNDNW